jgi:hypothetical protein
MSVRLALAFLAGQFANEDVPEIERVAVILQLDRTSRIDRFVALPVVFEDYVVDHELVVQLYGDVVAHHLDVERIPLAGGFVGANGRLARVFLVIEKTPGTNSVTVTLFGIPDLHLRCSAEIDATVALLFDLPVHIQFKVAVIFRRAQVFPLAVENQDAVFGLPVLPRSLVGFHLLGGQLFLRHLCAGLRVADEPLPIGQVFAVEERGESLRRDVERHARRVLGAERIRQTRECQQRKCDYQRAAACVSHYMVLVWFAIRRFEWLLGYERNDGDSSFEIRIAGRFRAASERAAPICSSN